MSYSAFFSLVSSYFYTLQYLREKSLFKKNLCGCPDVGDVDLVEDVQTPPKKTVVQMDDITVMSTYVAVIYDNAWWPGLVQSMDKQSNKAKITFMIPKGKNIFSWPPDSKPQRDELDLKEILCVIATTPILVNQRGHYKFPVEETQRIEALMQSVLNDNE
jgi:hypothetical protein